MNKPFTASYLLFKTIKHLNFNGVCLYSRSSKNILRNRYWYRNKDGQYKEYNESITVLPEEFENQDEYKTEKRTNEMYIQRYKNHLNAKEKMYSMQLPDQENGENEVINYCQNQDDMPKKMSNGDPYAKELFQCIFCKHNIPIDYKNTQLLSQFVSPYTGIIYSQQVTGMCYYKYTELQNSIIKSRRLGLMPFFYKETVFNKDPQLFNPNHNNLKDIPNNYDKRKLNAEDV